MEFKEIKIDKYKQGYNIKIEDISGEKSGVYLECTGDELFDKLNLLLK